ncbi:CMGC protein kinase [Apiosordaria backusii]|uniref:non-specific serine/threonine protein kinase n=1 Tax=Apiosordaria backusii TaxID=314023 RepID=A0AA40EZ87_9PEZI|nr:CMGC protein kinase [Apiosordaria backusii]
MALLLKWARALTRRAPSPPLRFPTTGFNVVPSNIIIEEEQFDEFQAGHYYPVTIGQVFDSKYQVLGKLGFGTTSIVWLARNLQEHKHVVLKVYTRDRDHSEEFQIYNIISKADRWHSGFPFVRTALDRFSIPRPGGTDHQCLVLNPAWESWKHMMTRNSDGRFTPDLLKPGLCQIFRALDYLHTECKIIHTDIKADNILLELVDKQVLERFTQSELAEPSPRKFVGEEKNIPVYVSRRFDRPKEFGYSVLNDFGSATRGDVKNEYDCQPDVYRSPEVMLEAEWSYPIDIWNIGVMIWDIFQGRHMFYGNDPHEKKYMTRAHLAEVVGMLGPPPLDLLQRGKRSKEFFDEKGNWIVDEIEIPKGTSIGASDERFEGKEKEQFVDFMKCMLQWRPEDRMTAKQLSEHPWIWP